MYTLVRYCLTCGSYVVELFYILFL